MRMTIIWHCNSSKKVVWIFPRRRIQPIPEFLYFSYVIGTSAQTADASISSQPMRVLNTLHIILAYSFNTTILAICINLVAELYSALNWVHKTSIKKDEQIAILFYLIALNLRHVQSSSF